MAPTPAPRWYEAPRVYYTLAALWALVCAIFAFASAGAWWLVIYSTGFGDTFIGLSRNCQLSPAGDWTCMATPQSDDPGSKGIAGAVLLALAGCIAVVAALALLQGAGCARNGSPLHAAVAAALGCALAIAGTACGAASAVAQSFPPTYAQYLSGYAASARPGYALGITACAAMLLLAVAAGVLAAARSPLPAAAKAAAAEASPAATATAPGSFSGVNPMSSRSSRGL